MAVLDNEPRGFAVQTFLDSGATRSADTVAPLWAGARADRRRPREPPAANGSPTGSLTAPGAAIAGAGSAGQGALSAVRLRSFSRSSSGNHPGP